MSVSFWRDNGMKFRATLALIALNLVVFLLQIMQPREFEIYFGLNYLFFEKNLLFQPLSSFFFTRKFHSFSYEYGGFVVVWFAN